MFGKLRLNLALLYGSEFVGKVLGLAVFGYLGRTLTTARYGDLEFALGVLFVLNLVIDAGLGHYGAREAAKRPGETERLVGQVSAIRGALVIVSLFVLAGIAATLPGGDALSRSLVMLQGLVLLPTPFVLTWVFQARDEMHVVAAAAIIRQVLLAAGVFAAVRVPSDVWLVPVWDGVGLAAAVGLQVILFSRAGGSVNPFRFLVGLRRVIVEAAPLAGSSVVWAIRLFSPLIALRLYGTPADAGVFGAGHRLVIAAHTFVWLYFFNLLPSLSRLGTETGLRRFQELFTVSMRFVGWVAFAGAVLGTVLAPVVMLLIYGADLAAGAADPFSVMVWVIAVAFVSGHHRFSLIALSRQTEEFWASIAGAVVAVAACTVLGLSGRLTPISAAWTFVVAESTTFIAATFLLKMCEPHLRVLRGTMRPAIFTLAGIVLVWAWSPHSTVAAATALAVLYAAGIVALERRDVTRLLAFRGEATPESPSRPAGDVSDQLAPAPGSQKQHDEGRNA